MRVSEVSQVADCCFATLAYFGCLRREECLSLGEWMVVVVVVIVG